MCKIPNHPENNQYKRSAKNEDVFSNLQHAVWLVPPQIMLNVNSRLRLDHKTR
jgi:hypothetical protein